jgi:hypothetical protein
VTFYTNIGTASNSAYYYVSAMGGSTSTTASTSTVLPAGSFLVGAGGGRAFAPPQLFIDDTGGGRYLVQDGKPCILELPDGTKIDVKANGSFEISDKGAKVVYRANRVRNFNPFLNASDKLEDFIRFCGTQGVRKGDMLQLPISLFIAWLVVEAAKADQEPAPAVPLLPDLRKRLRPHCAGCGRFIRRSLVQKQVFFCSPACFERHYMRNC